MTAAYISGGTRLRYVQLGAGTPVVFLHPTPLNHEYWLPMLAELPGVLAIVPDLRGHGVSELGDLPVGGFTRVPSAPVLTMAQLAQDVLVLLDSLKLETAVFVGCSIGGYVLLELWRQAPERMRGLAFVCSKPQPDAEAGLAKRAENIARVQREGAHGFLDTMAGTLPGATTRERNPQLIADVRSQMTLTAEAVVAVQSGLAVRPDSVPTVATIRVPVLSIAGAEDGSVSPAEMEAFAAAPGGCTSHVLPRAGHLAAFEQPGAVGEWMRDWLQVL
jgi:3-oxoadipate enol-lactonase